MRALIAAKKADLVPCIYILPCCPACCTWFSFIVVQACNLKLEDQSNINNLFRVVELGGTEYPYQADDGTCTVYSATEIAQIYVAAQTLITSQTAYHNALKSYVNAMTDAEEIAAVQYGMDLPEPYAAALSEKMAVAQAQMEAIMQKLGGVA